MIHKEKHELAGSVVKLKDGIDHPQFDCDGSDYYLEDWWDRVTGGSWMHANGNPACLIYAMRSALKKEPLPTDDEVVYGKVDSMGVLIHVSEIVQDQQC